MMGATPPSFTRAGKTRAERHRHISVSPGRKLHVCEWEEGYRQNLRRRGSAEVKQKLRGCAHRFRRLARTATFLVKHVTRLGYKNGVYYISRLHRDAHKAHPTLTPTPHLTKRPRGPLEAKDDEGFSGFLLQGAATHGYQSPCDLPGAELNCSKSRHAETFTNLNSICESIMQQLILEKFRGRTPISHYAEGWSPEKRKSELLTRKIARVMPS